MAKATQQMGRDLDPAIDWPSPKQDLRPFRLCRLACPRTAAFPRSRAPSTVDWGRTLFGIKTETSSSPTRMFGRRVWGGLGGAHDSSCFDGDHGDAAPRSGRRLLSTRLLTRAQWNIGLILTHSGHRRCASACLSKLTKPRISSAGPCVNSHQAAPPQIK
jgi:hypothetical protein